MEQKRPISGTRLTKHPENAWGVRQVVPQTALLASVALMSLFAHNYPRFPTDLTLELRLQAIHSGFLDQAMRAASELGRQPVATFLVLASALIFWFMRRRVESLLVVAAGLLSLGGQELKLLVDRPRPPSDLVRVLETDTTSSFPSGHSIFALAFFGVLFYLSGILIVNTVLKRAAQCAAVVLILLIGTSRVYLGVHWPSDVVGGYLVGGFILAVLVMVHARVSR